MPLLRTAHSAHDLNVERLRPLHEQNASLNKLSLKTGSGSSLVRAVVAVGVAPASACLRLLPFFLGVVLALMAFFLGM
jgi:hypothetical protein